MLLLQVLSETHFRNLLLETKFFGVDKFSFVNSVLLEGIVFKIYYFVNYIVKVSKSCVLLS